MTSSRRDDLPDPTDPTRNVIDLVKADGRRQDDLRVAESRHMHEIFAMQERHNTELRVAEAARLDAIRAVDQGNVSRAAEVAAAQAEALRAQVEAQRAASEDRLVAALQPMQTDVAELRKVQFQQQGEKSQQVEGRGSAQWLVTAAISVFIAFVSLGSLIAFVLIHG